jgi:hypothetical protein
VLSLLAYVLVPSFGTIVDVEISRGILATFFADFMDADSNQTFPGYVRLDLNSNTDLYFRDASMPVGYFYINSLAIGPTNVGFLGGFPPYERYEFDRSRALLAGPQSTLITQVGSLLFHPFNETSGQLVFDPADAAQYAHEREMYYAGTLDSHEWVVPVSVGLQGQHNFTPQACRFNSIK